MQTLVLAFIGDDEPGLVHALAEVLADHAGNWETGQMARLGHLFAGTLQVTVDAARAEALVEDFRALDGMLQVIVRTTSDGDGATEPQSTLTLDVVGADSRGIVETVAAALARPRISVLRLTSRAHDDDSDESRTFRFEALLSAGADVDLDELGDDLRALADELQVDLTLGRPTPVSRS